MDRFIAQFDWDGADAIYRHNRTGPAYRVTADEYEHFIDDYDRRQSLSGRYIVVGLLLFVGAVLTAAFFFPFIMHGRPQPFMPLAGCMVGAGGRWFADRWQSPAITRALRGRQPIAAALSGDERLSRTVGERSWLSWFGEAACFALLIPFLILLMNLFEGWRDPIAWLFLAICAISLALTVMQMLRKWGLERRECLSDHTASSLT